MRVRLFLNTRGRQRRILTIASGTQVMVIVQSAICPICLNCPPKCSGTLCESLPRFKLNNVDTQLSPFMSLPPVEGWGRDRVLLRLALLLRTFLATAYLYGCTFIGNVIGCVPAARGQSSSFPNMVRLRADE